MIQVRRSEDRGRADFGWLKATYSFSFGEYVDPKHQGFRDLLVINQDKVKADTGFSEHGHRDMEIITYVIEGKLQHKDSMGTGSVLQYGDVQRMSAGRGVRHSEWNGSKTDELHLLQIWILPGKKGLEPSYEEKHFSQDDKRNRLCLVAGASGPILVHQDIALYASILEKDRVLEHSVAPGRHVWIQLIHGGLQAVGETLKPGDGAAISDENTLILKATHDAEFLLFDLK